MVRWPRLLVGGGVWGLVLLAAGWCLLLDSGGASAAFRALWRHFTQERGSVTVEFPGYALVEVGDGVHLDVAGQPVLGEVEALLNDSGRPMPVLYQWCRAVQVRIFDKKGTVLHADSGATLVRVPQTASWVVQTLLTEQNIPRIAEEWNRTMLEHREQIFAMLTPIVRDLIMDLERQIETELPAFLDGHRDDVRLLGEEMRHGFLDKDFAAFFEERVWPVAEPRIRPIATAISREIWDQLPLWGLSWRLLYQALPFTSNDHVEQALRRFLEDQAMPILRSHSGEVIAATREIARELLAAEEAAFHLRRGFEALLESPRFHALCQVFLREVFLDNPRFHEAMSRRWNSPQVQAAVESATANIEPMVRRMGDIVLGTREEGITREFARVLRAQILLKDLQHILIHPGSEGTPLLADGAAIRATIRWDKKRQ